MIITLLCWILALIMVWIFLIANDKHHIIIMCISFIIGIVFTIGGIIGTTREIYYSTIHDIDQQKVIEEIELSKYTNSNKPTEENKDNETVCLYCPYCGTKISNGYSE